VLVSTHFERRVSHLEDVVPTIEGSREARAKSRRSEYERIVRDNPIPPDLAAAVVALAENEQGDPEEFARVERGLEEYFNTPNNA